MGREEIFEAILDIMCIDGPDGHTDGSEVITDFIMSIEKGDSKEWINEYRIKNKNRL